MRRTGGSRTSRPTRPTRRPGPGRVVASAVAAGTAVLAAGCGTGHEDAVLRAGTGYGDAVAAADWADACTLLAPGTRRELEQAAGAPCEEALPQEDPVAVTGRPAVHVYGTQAQLAYAGDTLFLSRYDDRWLVVAAVCRPREARPHDCAVTGG